MQPDKGLMLFSLAIVAVLGLQFLQLRLELLHGQHRPRPLQGQREEQEHDRQGQKGDRRAVVGPQLVEELERPGDEVVHQATFRSEEWASTGSGTGSHPDPPQG